MARLQLEVSGMTCGHCKAKVEHALKGVPGAIGAAVFLDAGAAEVDYDEGRSGAGAFVDAVRAAGYDARVSA